MARKAAVRMPWDIAECRAQSIGGTGLVDCLMEHGYRCPHAISFGYGVLCKHPDWRSIVARTGTDGIKA